MPVGLVGQGLLLLLLSRTDGRLPTRRASFLARRRRYRLDLFFFRLFGFSIAFLLAFSHAALLLVDGKQISPLLVSCRAVTASAPLVHRLHGFIMCRAPDRFVDFAGQFILADPMKACCQLRGLLCVHR